MLHTNQTDGLVQDWGRYNAIICSTELHEQKVLVITGIIIFCQYNQISLFLTYRWNSCKQLHTTYWVADVDIEIGL